MAPERASDLSSKTSSGSESEGESRDGLKYSEEEEPDRAREEDEHELELEDQEVEMDTTSRKPHSSEREENSSCHTSASDTEVRRGDEESSMQDRDMHNASKRQRSERGPSGDRSSVDSRRTSPPRSRSPLSTQSLPSSHSARLAGLKSQSSSSSAVPQSPKRPPASPPPPKQSKPRPPPRKSTRVRKKPPRREIDVSPPKRRKKSSGRQKSHAASRGKKGAGKSSQADPRRAKKKKKPSDYRQDNAASSGDEYTVDLYENYIGQIGALRVLGIEVGDVLNCDAWNNWLNAEERDLLRPYLPQSLSEKDQDRLVSRLLSGEDLHFGSPRDRIFDHVTVGRTHPRVKRWRQRVGLQLRRSHLTVVRTYHNTLTRRLLAYKAPKASTEEDFKTVAVGGLDGGTPTGGPLQAAPSKIRAAAAAAGQSPTNEWDEERWKRVLDYRNQETERYNVPERAFVFKNPWGNSVVGPLKRGPALDGGRPREHVLLRNERPSHVTILCIVRDASSRLPNGRGTRADICELVRDSQYLREGATFAQLNNVVSGALDRLHYEEDAPVKYDAEQKEWCYLHNNRKVEDFETPAWARHNAERRRRRAKASQQRGSGK